MAFFFAFIWLPPRSFHICHKDSFPSGLSLLSTPVCIESIARDGPVLSAKEGGLRTRTHPSLPPVARVMTFLPP